MASGFSDLLEELFAPLGGVSLRNTYIEIIDVFGIFSSAPQLSPQLCAALGIEV